VAIATPTQSHAELSVRASQAGKHVFCEKPISLDRRATVEAIETVRAAGVTFQVGFHRRFDPDWAAAVDRIQDGELGDVYLFRTSLRDMNPPDPAYLTSSGGFFVDVTVHDLDVARWMVGEVVEVTAHGAASDPAFDQAAGGEGRERLADGHAAHLEVAGEVALGRQLLAGVQLAGGDTLGQLLLDLHVDRRVRSRPESKALAESAYAGAHGRSGGVSAGEGRGMV